jgi:CBS domain-containing protein
MKLLQILYKFYIYFIDLINYFYYIWLNLINQAIMKVSEILNSKGHDVYSVTSEISVFEALKVMGEKNIGALPIIENDVLKGIFSERDYARKIVLQNKTSRDTMVKEIMTPNVVTVAPTDNIDDCMELMSNRRIRHLPVVENGKVVGLLSISDLVKVIISRQKETIDALHSYIAS